MRAHTYTHSLTFKWIFPFGWASLSFFLFQCLSHTVTGNIHSVISQSFLPWIKKKHSLTDVCWLARLRNALNTSQQFDSFHLFLSDRVSTPTTTTTKSSIRFTFCRVNIRTHRNCVRNEKFLGCTITTTKSQTTTEKKSFFFLSLALSHLRLYLFVVVIAWHILCAFNTLILGIWYPENYFQCASLIIIIVLLKMR